MNASQLTEEEKRRALLEMYPQGSLGESQAAISGIGEEFGFEPIATRGDVQEPDPEIRISRVAEQMPIQEAAQPAPMPQQQQKSGGFNWERAVAGLTGRHEGIAAYDRAQAERDQAPMREMEKRAKMMDLEDRQGERQSKLAELRASLAPDSPLSQSVAQSYATANKARAQMLAEKNPSLAQLFAQRAEMAAGKSAIDIKRMEDADREIMGNMLKLLDSDAKQAMAAQNFDYKNKSLEAMSSDRSADNALQREQLAETKRHNEAAEKEKAKDKFEINVKKPQEKLNAEITNLNVAAQQMQQLLDMKNKVNTGAISNLAAGVGEKFDLTSEDRNQMSAMLARVFNKETKTLAGAAVSASEWARISPQIPQMSDDDGVFVSKLKTALNETKRILAERQKEYQRLSDGSSMDQSVTAKEAMATSNDAKAAKARAAIASPKATPEQKSNAKKWLEMNGYAE